MNSNKDSHKSRIVPSIMLIDDDRATTVYNELIIVEHGSVQEVITYNNPEEALNYLKNPANQNPNPDLILLDINMPRMDGWEFVDAFSNQLKVDKKTIIMLSTTADKKEYEMVASNEFLSGIKSKPLTFEVLDEILDIYYDETCSGVTPK